MKIKNLKIIFIGIIFLVLIGQVSAWGVLPAKQLIKFTDKEQTIKITLKNNNLNEGFFKVEFAGELEKYVNYDNSKLIYFSPDDAEKEIELKIKLPTKELIPGRNTLKIILQQVDTSNNENTLSSTITLVAEAVVNVPYKGNFVIANVNIPQTNNINEIPFHISMINKGEKEVLVWADVVIKGPTNQEIASWTTPKKMLGYLSTDKLNTEWKGKKQSGVYLSEIIFHYGNKTQVLRKEFVVGKKDAKIIKIDYDKFTLGEINKLDIKVQNTWNEKIQNVYVKVFVSDKNNKIIQTFKSTPDSLDAFQTKSLTAYWDTSNLVVGKYNLQTQVVIDSNEGSQKTIPVTVSMDKLSFSPSGQVISSKETKDSSNLTSVLVILLIVVVITNIMILAYFRKTKNKNKDKNNDTSKNEKK